MRIKKYYKLIKVDYEDSAYFRITNTSNTGGFFTITMVGSPTTADLKYSLDGVNWTTADLSTDFSLEVDAGANVYMKGTNTSGFNSSNSNYYKMAMDVDHTIGGNIMSIVDETNYATTTSTPSYCFSHLFYGDTHLVNAGGVNFGGVTSITNYGFSYMYSNCTSLTTPSDLSSVTIIGWYGCSYMYSGCTSLTTPSDLSSVTSITNYGCQNMYSGCTSLTTPSDLSSVTSIGNNGCQSMYYGCTSLTTGSDLSSVTSIGSYGCGSMYGDCTSLTKAIAPNISTWNASIFSGWLDSAPATGVVRKPAGLDIPTDTTSGVPTGWTTEDY